MSSRNLSKRQIFQSGVIFIWNS